MGDSEDTKLRGPYKLVLLGDGGSGKVSVYLSQIFSLY